MSFLPVAERELRVAARRRSTSWTRTFGALIALVVTMLFVCYWALERSSLPPGGQGRALFTIMVWLTFFAVVCAGLFLTADCISEEKREGTFGLLFLTSLRGYDVVIGKLLASSLVGFYGLLAVIPILALSLLMGGVTGDEFWKTVLALLSTMLVSLGVGLFVSVLSRESQKATVGALIVLALLVAGGPTIDAIRKAINPTANISVWSLISPMYLLETAWWISGPDYWVALVTNQVVTAVFFLGAIVLAPRLWRDTGRVSGGLSRLGFRGRGYGSIAFRVRQRTLLLGNPVQWLCARDRWPVRAAWAWTLLLVAGCLVLMITLTGGDLFGWSFFSGLFVLPFYLVASQAGRFLIEGRQSGALELLLCTPVTPRQIIQGQWLGWLRRFGPPILVVAIASAVLTAAGSYSMWKSMVAMTAATPTPPPSAITTSNAPVGTGVTNDAGVTSPQSTATATGSSGNVTVTTVGRGASFGRLDESEIVAIVGGALLSSLAMLGNLTALVWFGMWTGMTSRKLTASSLRTLVLVQAVPWLLIMFVCGFVLPSVLIPIINTSSFVWVQTIIFGILAFLSLVKDFGFILWAHRRLHTDFRGRVAGTIERRRRGPDPAPPPVAPPILPATT